MSRKNIVIIIGANAGDEGKGLATDYFASLHDNGIVVMTNGGSQRGHTVELPDGTRHIFQHFGSGTFKKWATYYSKHFILNPMQFCKEWDELKALNVHPVVYCDVGCMWSTPYDMIYNQILSRLHGRYDTCGMGINATLQRYQYCKQNGIQTYRINDMVSPYTNAIERFKYLLWVRNYYDKLINDEVKNPGTNEVIKDLYAIFNNTDLLSHFAADIQAMNSAIHFNFCMPLYLYDNIIFENGQGLLIDKDVDIYGTPTNTGVDIPLNILNDCIPDTVKDIELCYVTRSYITRHGYGDLREECSISSIGSMICDHTNNYNINQGHLRYGILYPNDLAARINRDYYEACHWNYANSGYINSFEKSLLITHLNEHHFEVDKLKNSFNIIYTSKTKFSKDVVIYWNDTEMDYAKYKQ